MTDPMNIQYGGAHYKGMAIEPFEFGMANRYDPCIFSTMKYVARHHLKGGAEDLRKGAHICLIRVRQVELHGLPREANGAIHPDDFSRKNGLRVLESRVIGRLHFWALCPDPRPVTQNENAEFVIRLLNKIITETYGETP